MPNTLLPYIVDAKSDHVYTQFGDIISSYTFRKDGSLVVADKLVLPATYGQNSTHGVRLDASGGILLVGRDVEDDPHRAREIAFIRVDTATGKLKLLKSAPFGHRLDSFPYSDDDIYFAWGPKP